MKTRGRRAAVLLVMTIATGAIVATSPAAPAIRTQVTRVATLDAANPVIVQEVQVRVSGEALVPETIYGGVKLNVPADGIGERGAEPLLRVTAVPHDPALLAESVRTEYDGGEFFSIDSCETGRPCEAMYSIVIEWLEPVEGRSLTVGWEFEASIAYGGSVPEGAEIDVIHIGDPEHLSEPPSELFPSVSPVPAS